CLQKESGRRYLSASDLAEDLRLFQAGEPIQARPIGRIERALKWARRKPVIAALSASVIVVTLLGAGAFTLAYLEAIHQRGEAIHQQGEAIHQRGVAEENEKAAQKALVELTAAQGKIVEERNTAREERGKAETARDEEQHAK